MAIELIKNINGVDLSFHRIDGIMFNNINGNKTIKFNLASYVNKTWYDEQLIALKGHMPKPVNIETYEVAANLTANKNDMTYIYNKLCSVGEPFAGGIKV